MAQSVTEPLPPFAGFAPSAFWPFRRRLATLNVTDDFADVRRSMRDVCPRRPGVYGMLDAHDQLIYVGMSTVLPKRLVTYFQSSGSERKEYRIASHTNRLVWEVIGHSLAAELRELELIRHHLPRFNVRGRRPGKALGYLYISREEAPRVRVARQVPRGVRYSWGPLAITWRIREAVEAVNRQFKLRDCRSDLAMNFAEQGSLFALELRAECLRGETGSCLGPCAGLCTRTAYSTQLRAARAFLDGRDAVALARSEEDVKCAAALQQFERASAIRDNLVRLRYLADVLALLREPALPEQFVFSATAGDRKLWYAVAARRVVTVLRAPASGEQAARCAARLEKVYSALSLEQFTTDRVATQILASWFRTRREEPTERFTPRALEQCRRMSA